MKKVSLYNWLATVAVSVGAGVLLGNSLYKEGSSTPLWIGGILVFLAAIIFGMAVGMKSSDVSANHAQKSLDSSAPKELPKTESKNTN